VIVGVPVGKAVAVGMEVGVRVGLGGRMVGNNVTVGVGLDKPMLEQPE
jgi:hypothetical protein